jgi:Fe-Mn family superoxide dismutase
MTGPPPHKLGDIDMNDPGLVSRRDLLKTAGAASVVAYVTPSPILAQNAPSPEKPAMTLQSAPSFTAQAAPKPLGFDPSKLNGLSEKLIRSHWENNYGGSGPWRGKTIGRCPGEQGHATRTSTTIQRNTLRTGSVVFHEYYFDNLGGGGRRIRQ